MKIILTFILRVLNLIFFFLFFCFMLTFPIWPLIGYLIVGKKCFDYDPDEWLAYLWNHMHKPLDLFEEYIEDMDGNHTILNKSFWK